MAAKRIIPVPKRGATTTTGGVDNFLDLTDTPNSYAGFGGSAVLVNVGETGLVFSTSPLDTFGVRDFTTVSDVVIGQPVYGFSATDEVELARANMAVTARVIGFSVLNILATNITSVINAGYIYRADWTPITGTALLTFGVPYFLDAATAGKMTVTAPTTPGEYLVALGVSVSDTIFSVNIGSPVRRA